MKEHDMILSLIDKIREALFNQDAHAFEQHVDEIDDFILEWGCFPVELFKQLLIIMKSPQFQTLQKSWVLLRLFTDEVNVEKLSEQQIAMLVDVLESAYSKFSDPTTCLLTTELFVDLAKEQHALEILCRFSRIDANIPRALIPYGLKYFIKACSFSHLKQQALQQLLYMQQDTDEQVKQEAIKACKSLQVKTL